MTFICTLTCMCMNRMAFIANDVFAINQIPLLKSDYVKFVCLSNWMCRFVLRSTQFKFIWSMTLYRWIWSIYSGELWKFLRQHCVLHWLIENQMRARMHKVFFWRVKQTAKSNKKQLLNQSAFLSICYYIEVLTDLIKFRLCLLQSTEKCKLFSVCGQFHAENEIAKI